MLHLWLVSLYIQIHLCVFLSRLSLYPCIICLLCLTRLFVWGFLCSLPVGLPESAGQFIYDLLLLIGIKSLCSGLCSSTSLPVMHLYSHSLAFSLLLQGQQMNTQRGFSKIYNLNSERSESLSLVESTVLQLFSKGYSCLKLYESTMMMWTLKVGLLGEFWRHLHHWYQRTVSPSVSTQHH